MGEKKGKTRSGGGEMVTISEPALLILYCMPFAKLLYNSVLLTELRVCGSTHSMWILCSTVRQDCSLMLISAILCIAPPQSLRNLILRRADVWRGEDVEGHYMESHIAPCGETNVCVCGSHVAVVSLQKQFSVCV